MSDTRLISRNPVDLLVGEHERLGSLLEAYEDLAPFQTREKHELIQQIEDEIARHVGAEEALFYPALLEMKDAKIHERVAEAIAEHRVLEHRVTALRGAPPGQKTESAMHLLRTHALRHMEYEQLEVFPFAWGLPRISLNQLGLEIEERRARDGGP